MTMKISPALFKGLQVIITALIFTVLLSPDVFAEQQRVNSEKPAKAKLSNPAQEKKMPNVTFANICDPSKMRATRRGNMLTISCSPSSSTGAMSLAAKPGVQRSEINCKYTENDQGGLDIKSCTCKADDDSNCTGFITWCAKQGADVGGNNQSATCD